MQDMKFSKVSYLEVFEVAEVEGLLSSHRLQKRADELWETTTFLQFVTLYPTYHRARVALGDFIFTVPVFRAVVWSLLSAVVFAASAPLGIGASGSWFTTK